MAYMPGSRAITSGQVSVTDSAGTILAARQSRRSVLLINHGSIDVYVGPATVTTSNGLLLKANASLTIDTWALIQGITASGTGTIHYLEEHE